MRKRFTWICLSLPWIAGTLLLAAFCLQAYLRGRGFVPGFHAFKWMGNLMAGACIYVPALLIAGVSAIRSRRQLTESRALVWAAALSAISLAMPFVAIPAMSRCFFAGRDAAYRSVDAHAIYEASVELGKRIRHSGLEIVYARWQTNSPALPPAIARLSPLEVVVTASAVAIQMDGGGTMYHEGIGVVLAEKGDRLPRREDIRPLHETLPVYLYRLYDYRQFLDGL